MASSKPYPSDARRLPLSGVCRICGDKEPFHVHDGERRIENYFTVGRGQTDFEAAQEWKARALKAETDERARLEADLAALREAAQAVVDQWNGPHDGRTERDEAVEPLIALLSGVLVLASADSEGTPEMLTPHEARALRLACIFGTPDPTPPEIASALRKIKAIEQGDYQG